MIKLLRRIKQRKKDKIFSDYPCSDYLHNALKFLADDKPDVAYEEICNALIRSGNTLSFKEEELLELIKSSKELNTRNDKKYVYEELDTRCDKCWILHNTCIENGLVMECTTLEDTRKHYIPIPGGHCPGFVRKEE